MYPSTARHLRYLMPAISKNMWRAYVASIGDDMFISTKGSKRAHTLDVPQLNIASDKKLANLVRPLLRCFTPKLLAVADVYNNTALHLAASFPGVVLFSDTGFTLSRDT